MFASADKEEQRATVQRSSVMDAWDALSPTLWASLSHTSHNTSVILPHCSQTGLNLSIITHQSQERDASAGKGSDVEVVGHAVLVGGDYC